MNAAADNRVDHMNVPVYLLEQTKSMLRMAVRLVMMANHKLAQVLEMVDDKNMHHRLV